MPSDAKDATHADSATDAHADSADSETIDTRVDSEVTVDTIDVAPDVTDTADAAPDLTDAAPDAAEPDTADSAPDSVPEDVAEPAPDAIDDGPDVTEPEPDSIAEPAPDTVAEPEPDTLPDTAMPDTRPEDVADTADTVGSTDAGPPCNTTVSTFPVDPSPHIETCSEISYPNNPPTSGPHYPIWAAYKAYQNPVALGFLVHSMEHGAVVVYYRCDAAAPCDDDVAALNDYLAALPADPMCEFPVHARIVVAPSYSIPTRFAASAWGANLTSDCFDLDALGAFIDAHYAHGSENFCSDGIDLDTVLPDSGFYCPPQPPPE